MLWDRLKKIKKRGNNGMRTMLLSFRQDVFQRVISGDKIYEHRRSLPDEPVKAYVYVSRTTQAICGIMYLSNKTSLNEWKEKYKDDLACVGRIEDYLKQHQYGMEINKFVFTNAIPLAVKIQSIQGFTF